MNTGLAALLIPDEMLWLVLVAGGICLIVGARRPAMAAFAFVVAAVALPPLLSPLIQQVPLWVLWLLLGYVIFLAPFALVSAFQTLATPALGAKVAGEMGGHLAADVARFMLVAPFRAIAAIVKGVVRLVARSLRGTACMLAALCLAVAAPPAPAGGKKELAKAAVARLLARDAARDATRVAQAKALHQPLTVWRYTSAAQARRELRNGVPAGRHFTPEVTRGRPPTPQNAQRRYGLPQRPEVRLTVRLGRGAMIQRNKAVGGEPGRGEIVTRAPLPAAAVRNTTTLSR